MKYFFLTAVFLLFSSYHYQSKEYVLICNSKTAKAYHKDYEKESQYCEGLQKCTHKIERVLKSSVDSTRTACKLCWPKGK